MFLTNRRSWRVITSEERVCKKNMNWSVHILHMSNLCHATRLYLFHVPGLSEKKKLLKHILKQFIGIDGHPILIKLNDNRWEGNDKSMTSWIHRTNLTKNSTIVRFAVYIKYICLPVMLLTMTAPSRTRIRTWPPRTRTNTTVVYAKLSW